MFSDSHCHLRHTSQWMPHFPLMLQMMHDEGFPFVMDIGTDAGDFIPRFQAVADAWSEYGAIPDFIHFAAGLWPSKKAIENQAESLAALEQDIQTILKSGIRYSAVGECGIDRYWNGKDDKNGGTTDLEGEEALFKAQLAMAKRYNLPVVIHTRDGFEATLKCIDEIGWHKGVIHCFSYGKDEARQFFERGWYISFPGTITYYKTPEEKQRIAEIMQSIPHELLLLETDAPYLTPAAGRGEANTPLFISETYRQASEFLNVPIEYLCDLVYKNCCTLFAVKN